MRETICNLRDENASLKKRLEDALQDAARATNSEQSGSSSQLVQLEQERDALDHQFHDIERIASGLRADNNRLREKNLSLKDENQRLLRRIEKLKSGRGRGRRADDDNDGGDTDDGDSDYHPKRRLKSQRVLRSNSDQHFASQSNEFESLSDDITERIKKNYRNGFKWNDKDLALDDQGILSRWYLSRRLPTLVRVCVATGIGVPKTKDKRVSRTNPAKFTLEELRHWVRFNFTATKSFYDLCKKDLIEGKLEEKEVEAMEEAYFPYYTDYALPKNFQPPSWNGGRGGNGSESDSGSTGDNRGGNHNRNPSSNSQQHNDSDGEKEKDPAPPEESDIQEETKPAS